MPETHAGAAPTAQSAGFSRALAQALAFEEIVVDVRKDKYTITAEAMYPRGLGITFCRHGKSSEDPQAIIDALIEAVEKLGVSAGRYRIVREDLPPQPVIEYRYPASSEPSFATPPLTPSNERSPGKECEVCAHSLCSGECEEDDVLEEGENCGCS